MRKRKFSKNPITFRIDEQNKTKIQEIPNYAEKIRNLVVEAIEKGKLK